VHSAANDRTESWVISWLRMAAVGKFSAAAKSRRKCSLHRIFIRRENLLHLQKSGESRIIILETGRSEWPNMANSTPPTTGFWADGIWSVSRLQRAVGETQSSAWRVGAILTVNKINRLVVEKVRHQSLSLRHSFSFL